MRQTAKHTAKPWRTDRPPTLDTLGGLAVCYFKCIYRANNYSANRWRPDWRSDPSFGGLTPSNTVRPPDRHRTRGVAALSSQTPAGGVR